MHARELLEVERVAAAVVVEMRRVGRRDGRAEQLAGLVARERAELAADHGRPRDRARSSAVRSRCGHLARPRGEGQQHAARRAAVARSVAEQLDRGGVAPVQVVEHQHERPRRARAARAARARRDSCGSARGATAGSRGRARRRESDGSTPASSPRTSSPRAARAAAARARGRTRRARRRRPRRAGRARAPTRSPRARCSRARRRGARARRAGASCRCPGSPISSISAGRPSSSSSRRARSGRARRRARPDVPPAEPMSPPPPRRAYPERVHPEDQGAGSGCCPDVRGGRAAAGLPHALLPPSPQASAGRVRRRVRLVQGLTTARCAGSRRSPRAAPAATPSGGTSRRPPRPRRSRSCPSSSPPAPR